jgi:hypothetical protein
MCGGSLGGGWVGGSIGDGVGKGVFVEDDMTGGENPTRSGIKTSVSLVITRDTKVNAR